MRTITELAKANVKKDSVRSILILISITLTTLLLTAVSSAGYGPIGMQTANAAELYGEFYGIFRGIAMDSYQNQLRAAKFSMRIMKLPAYLFCVIITFISFMNMANTMITNIITRKQEFGVLQAIGMTNRQLHQSLQLEGMLFSAGTAVVSLVAGIPLGYALFRYCKANAFTGLGIYHFPCREVLFLFVFVGVLQMVLSFILSRNIRKESLIDRIRYHG